MLVAEKTNYGEIENGHVKRTPRKAARKIGLISASLNPVENVSRVLISSKIKVLSNYFMQLLNQSNRELLRSLLLLLVLFPFISVPHLCSHGVRWTECAWVY